MAFGAVVIGCKIINSGELLLYIIFTIIMKARIILISVVLLLFAAGALLYFKSNKFLSILPYPYYHITIRIQPFDDMPQTKVNDVFLRIKKIYPHTVLLAPIPLPAPAYYKERDRYRADSIIAYLSRNTTDTCVTIGLTAQDVSTTGKGNIKDWGVMGLGYQPGNACVVSTFRLNKHHLPDQLFKVAVHELGHTQGLPHCTTTTCFMRDAEGGNHLDEETGFCPHCRNVLVSKGWILPD